ncbi:MAG TPA: transcription elongation factor GreA [Anaerolineales bacterium]|jgi:transcription elongation factor GreA|nr:transcription elongation factor GreA [Anaerolineales bacterium]
MGATLLTPEGYQKLQEELNYLRESKRKEVADRLHEAMEGGELIEDAEYEAAKNEQSFVEGRIQELETILANARVIEMNSKHEVAQLGARVTIREDSGDPEEYIIVSSAEANPREGKISIESPIGRALIDHKAGDEIVIEAPGGSFTVHLLKVV